MNLNFFVNYSFEKLPRFCSTCKALGHSEATCIKQNHMAQDNGRNKDVKILIEKNKSDENIGCEGPIDCLTRCRTIYQMGSQPAMCKPMHLQRNNNKLRRPLMCHQQVILITCNNNHP